MLWRPKAIVVAAALLLIVSMAGCASSSHTEKGAVESYTEEELGLRTDTLYSEDTVLPDRGVFPTESPGSGNTLERAFDNSPPMIPHDTTDLLPITTASNMCVECHMPDVAGDMGATPVPKSHLVDLRTGEDLQGKLSGTRYECTLCHATQATIPPAVTNDFQGGFRDEAGKSRSNLADTLREGVVLEK